MSDIVSSIEKEEAIQEAVYAQNIGFEEIVRFYQKASDSDIKKIEQHIKNNKWSTVKGMFKKVLGVELK